MNKFIKTLVLSAAVAATTLTATAGVVEARDRNRDGYWREGDPYEYRKPRRHNRDRDRDYGRNHGRNHGRDAVIGGALGLATGVIIGGALANQERRVYVEPDYYPEPEPRVIYRQPVVVPTYEPWTQSWYNYCSQRYRSFNPNTGTFVGYDGLEHFCTAG
jgi:hypothetical protein